MRVVPASFFQDSRRSSQEDDLDLGLKDRVAILTGGSRGIGKACAKELLAEDAIAVLVSKSPDSNAAAVREFEKTYPGRVIGIPADVNNDAAIGAMTAQVIAKFGRIDILINAAATVISQDFFKMDDAHLTSLLDQKFNAAARCIRHVVPQMRKHKWGRIINVSGARPERSRCTVKRRIAGCCDGCARSSRRSRP